MMSGDVEDVAFQNTKPERVLRPVLRAWLFQNETIAVGGHP